MTSSAIEIESRSMARSSSREDPTGLRGPTSTSSWRSSSREDPSVGAHDGAHTDEGALDEDAHDDAEYTEDFHREIYVSFGEKRTINMNDLAEL